MLGICLAGYILIGMGQEKLYVYCGCGILQVIWLVSVMWYQSWNKTILSQKDLESHLHKEMVFLSDHWYVMFLRWLKQICGFCFFVFLTSFGWFVATFSIVEYSNINIYLKTAVLISLGLFAILLPWVSLLNQTTSALISKSVNQGIKGAALSSSFIGFCIYYLVFCYVVAALGYAKKDDTISWPFGLVVLGILIFWIIVYKCWYKYALQLEAKSVSSDSYEQVRRKCLDYQNALRDIWYPYYNKEVTSTLQGLIFRDIHGEKLYRWEEIKNITFDSLNIVSVIDQEGNKSEGKMPSVKKIKPKEKIEAIWNQWADHVAGKEEIIKFEYPFDEQRKDEKNALAEAWFAIAGGIGFPIMLIFMRMRENDLGILIPAFILLSSLIYLIWGVFRLKRRTKILSCISIEQDRILVHYKGGEIQECRKSDITDSTLKYDRTGVMITFKGLPDLKKIERVSYFPVLKQKLLEIIGTEYNNLRRQTKFYNYPSHGVRVCQQMLREAESQGESLCSVEKGYLFGTGASFRMFFRKEKPSRIFRVVVFYGRLRDENDPIFEGCRMYAVLTMKLCWITLGYYYFLEENTAQRVND
ncbi:MAG: hypothetical protein ACYSYL_13400 [Planctomycetota bacterium]|jgi:hypothetical protein